MASKGTSGSHSALAKALAKTLGANEKKLAKALGVKPRRRWRTRVVLWLLRSFWRVALLVARQGWVWRRALLPIYLASAAFVLAAVGSVADKGAVTLAVLAAAGSVPVYWWSGGPALRWTRRRRLKPLSHRCWYAGGYAALSVWSVVAASWRLGPPMPGVWAALAGSVWVAWLWHHRVRIEDIVEDALDERQQVWQEKVKPLKATELVGIVDLDAPSRWEADVNLAGTDLLVKDVVSAVPYVAKAFHVPVSNVIADYKGGRLEHLARLTVVRDNPCEAPIGYDESWIPTEADVAEGVVPFHFYPNGLRGKVRLFLPGAGAVNSLFTGDVRVGKSAGMEAKMTQAAWTGVVWPMASDPQGGVSMPTWCKADGSGLARWQATDLDAIYAQLCGWRDAVKARSAAMASVRWTDRWGDEQVGINCWDPSVVSWPLLGWACDEFWMLMKIDEFFEIFKECFKIQGKCGMYMDIATQYPGIEEFHNDMALRQPLTAGNMLSYRNTASSVKEMILPSGMPSPMNIPWETPEGDHTKGTLIAVSQAPRSSLPVYSRSVWVERGRYWASRAMARAPELDPITAAAFAKYMPSAVQLPIPSPVEQAREVIEVAAGVAEAAGGPTPATPAKRLTVLDRVVEYLGSREDGRAHTGVIAEALEVPLGTVSTTLSRAADKTDRVHQVRRGVWALGPAPRAGQLEFGEERAA